MGEEKKLAAAIQASLAEEEEKKQQQKKTKAKAATKAVSFAHCERIPASAPNDDDSDLAAAIAASLAEEKKRKKKKKIVRRERSFVDAVDSHAQAIHGNPSACALSHRGKSRQRQHGLSSKTKACANDIVEFSWL